MHPPPSRARAALVRKVEVFPTQPGRGQRVAASAGRRGLRRTEVPGGQDARSLGRSVSLEGKQVLRGKAVGTVPKPQVARKRAWKGGALQGALMAPLSAFRLFLVFYPEPGLLNRKKKLLKTSPVGVGGAGGRFAPHRPLPPHPRTRGLTPGSLSRGRTHPVPAPALTCAALAPARVAGVPGQANSTSAGKRHSAPSSAPSRRAWSPAPDAAEGTQAPRPMAPADSLSGLGRRGGAAAARITAPGGGRAAAPEGNQLAAHCREHPRRLQPGAQGPGPLGRWRWPGQGPLGGVTWQWGGEEGPGRQRRDRRQGLRLRRECQLGSPNSLEVE